MKEVPDTIESTKRKLLMVVTFHHLYKVSNVFCCISQTKKALKDDYSFKV